MDDRVVIPLITAVVAFVASYVAAVTANHGAAENLQAQFAEERRKDDREKRAEVYTAYMAAVGDYAVPFRGALECYRRTAVSASELPAPCRQILTADRVPLATLRSALANVYIFGTKETGAAADALRKSMTVFEEGESQVQPPVGPTTAPGSPSQRRTLEAGPSTVADKAHQYFKDYESAYLGYRRSMCRELTTDPQIRC